MRAGARGSRIGLSAARHVLMLGVAVWARNAAAQTPPTVHGVAGAVLAYDWSDVVPGRGGRSLGEIRLVRPTVMLEAGAWRRLRLVGMLNLEGATIPEGELALGDWGEGFVDRRHPHTYLHELVLSATDLLGHLDGSGNVSLSAGKGFAPFGTDDPMVRPFLRFPVNHHLSQILERAVVIGAFRARAASAEVGLFNGDEPERPGQWPRIGGRFGDSWAVRLTAYPQQTVEVQASYAEVHSPEHRPGAGTDQTKWNLSARWSGPVQGHPVYGLVEWARTSEAAGFFVFHSLLAEGAWTAGRHRLQYRFERTERPEEERLSGFRSLRPHLENSILGTTRWTIHTAGYEIDALRTGWFRLRPLAELSYGTISRVGGGVFDIRTVYGRDRFWSVSLGVRLGAGMDMHRMGPYGSMTGEEGTGHHHGGAVE
ncbi:MAG TPA: hypothetical protein VIG08_06985 [Gemmatimonadales bacterium]